MSRLMSVSHTEQAVRERRKTVTRRLGWQFLKAGDRLTLCRKVMGRKPGEPLDRIVDVEIVDVRRERLIDMPQDDVAREAVDPATSDGWIDPDDPRADDWARWFAHTFGCRVTDEVTRIEWRYLS